MTALGDTKVVALGTVTEPKDFSDSGSEHRRSVLASTALITVLLTSKNLKPAVFGVDVSVPMLWVFLGAGHLYFFVMWRLTAPIEADSDKRFWNVKGLWKQAIAGGTSSFPGKTKAQLLLIRALPIWAFLGGLVGVAYGFYTYYRAL